MSSVVDEIAKWLLLGAAFVMTGTAAEHVLALLVVATLCRVSAGQSQAGLVAAGTAFHMGRRFLWTFEQLGHPRLAQLSEEDQQSESALVKATRSSTWATSFDTVRFWIAVSGIALFVLSA